MLPRIVFTDKLNEISEQIFDQGPLDNICSVNESTNSATDFTDASDLSIFQLSSFLAVKIFESAPVPTRYAQLTYQFMVDRKPGL